MRDFLFNTETFTTEQWLAICILGFILLAVLVMIHRLLAILKMSRRQTYKPNFRRLRRYHPVDSDHADSGSDNDR